MPVFWVLVVGALLFLALRMLENHHRADQKQTIEQQHHTIVSETAVPAEAETSLEAAAPVDAAPEPDKNIEKIPFLDTMAGLPNETRTELRQLNLTSPKAIIDTPDQTLLAIKGIGPARLKQIRAICADATDPESEFVAQATN